MRPGDGNKKPLSRLPARGEAIESFETDAITPNNHGCADLFSPFGIFEGKNAGRVASAYHLLHSMPTRRHYRSVN